MTDRQMNVSLRLRAEGGAATAAEVDKVKTSLAGVGTAAEQASRKVAQTAGQTAFAMRMLPAQMTDVAVGLSSGQSPFMVLMQQGGQLKDMFGGIGPAIGAVGGYVAGLINPFTVAAAAAAAVGYAIVQGFSDSRDAAAQFATSSKEADQAFRGLGAAVGSVDFMSMYKAFNDADGATRRLIASQVELRMEILKTTTEAARADLAGALSDLGQGVNWFPGDDDIRSKLVEQVDTLKIAGQQRVEFVKTMMALDAQTVTVAEAFEKLRGVVPLTTKEGREFVATMSKAVDAELRLKDATDKSAEALQKMRAAGSNGQVAIPGRAPSARATKDAGPIDVFDNGSFVARDKATAQAIRESWDFENWAWGEIAKDRERAAQAAQKTDDAVRKAAESLYGATTSGRFDKFVADLKLAEEAFAKGFIDQRQLDAITDRLMGVNRQMEDSRSIGKDLGMTFSSAFEDAIVGGKKFSEVLQGLADDVLRLVTRKNITEPLADGVASIDWGSIFSLNALGGVYSGAGISAWSGRLVDRPTVFPFASGIGLMGEAGPEAILPLKRGANGRLGVEGGGNNVVVNVIESPGNGGKTERRQQGGINIVDVFVEQVKRSIAGDISDGRGAVPAAMTSAYGLNRAAGAY